ncbi:hypothetical protein HOH11_00910 [Candidatus Woesearchaeota archaeon]|jgi:hypothetical protein|nr:hypothetical protein [Candidatus Woesearchaeota archaeon]MBT6023149.1 hypothetical protein [Candidatus Woesearchaeota archaeon]
MKQNKLADELVREFGLYSKNYKNKIENQNGKIVSIYSFGTAGTSEENESSDLDLNVVFRDEYVSVKSSRDKINNHLKKIKQGNKDLDIWYIAEKWFKNPAKHLRGGPPDSENTVGLDEIIGTVMLNNQINQSTETYVGKSLDEIVNHVKPFVDSLDGFEMVIYSQAEFARGAFNRINTNDQIKKDGKIAKAILFSAYGLHLLNGGKTVKVSDQGFYSSIRDKVLESLSLPEPVINLIQESAEVKKGNRSLEWDWTKEYPEHNNIRMQRICDSMEFLINSSAEVAERKGYFLDKQRTIRVRNRVLNKSEEIVGMLLEDPNGLWSLEKHFHETLELYANEFEKRKYSEKVKEYLWNLGYGKGSTKLLHELPDQSLELNITKKEEIQQTLRGQLEPYQHRFLNDLNTIPDELIDDALEVYNFIHKLSNREFILGDLTSIRTLPTKTSSLKSESLDNIISREDFQTDYAVSRIISLGKDNARTIDGPFNELYNRGIRDEENGNLIDALSNYLACIQKKDYEPAKNRLAEISGMIQSQFQLANKFPNIPTEIEQDIINYLHTIPNSKSLVNQIDELFQTMNTEDSFKDELYKTCKEIVEQSMTVGRAKRTKIYKPVRTIMNSIKKYTEVGNHKIPNINFNNATKQAFYNLAKGK